MGFFEELASCAVHHVPHDFFGLIREELSGVECQSPRILDIFPDPPVLDIAPTHRDSLSQIVFGDELPSVFACDTAYVSDLDLQSETHGPWDPKPGVSHEARAHDSDSFAAWRP